MLEVMFHELAHPRLDKLGQNLTVIYNPGIAVHVLEIDIYWFLNITSFSSDDVNP